MKGFLGKLPLTVKLVIAFIVLGLTPMLVVAWLTQNKAETVFSHEAMHQLETGRDMKLNAVEQYFAQIEGQVLTLAQDHMIVNAVSEFTDGYNSYLSDSKVDPSALASMRTELNQYYEQEFGAEYLRQNQRRPDVSALQRGLSDEAVALQRAYIFDNANVLGQKDTLDSANGAQRYHKAHGVYHPVLRDYLKKFGYYDLFLVDVKTGNVVYSVFKELDFATNLISGPHAQTNLGEAYRKAAHSLNKGEATLADYRLYPASYDAPAGFIATPVFAGSEKVGVLIFQMPMARINDIMSTRIGGWKSGDSYLVGDDFLMRSDSQHHPETLSVAASFRNPEQNSNRSESVEKALKGEKGSLRLRDMHGDEVLVAYSPLSLAGLKWVVVTEVDVAEAFAPARELSELVLATAVVAALVIALVAFIIGRFLAAPIRQLAEVLRQVTETGDFSLRVGLHQKDEVGQAAAAVDNLLTNVGACMAETNTVLRALGQGNFREQVNGAYNGSLKVLAEGVNATVGQLQSAQAEQDRQTRLASDSAEESKRLMAQAQAEAVVTGRIKQALDVCNTSVLITDAHGTVTYLNRALSDLMARVESDLRRDLPGFRVTALMGADLANLMLRPAGQASLLEASRGSREVRMVLGGRSFDVVATPVRDASDTVQGYVVEWQDQTEVLARQEEERRIADENARIRQALDNVSTNTMIADRDYNIIYLNRAIETMMTAAESDLRQALPDFDARRLLGANMDVFHRNPAHQRQALSHLQGPLNTQIKVAGRTFALVANPILNEQRERIGTVVEWQDRTAEVAVEQEVDQLVVAAAGGDFSYNIDTRGKTGFFLTLCDGLNRLVATTRVAIEDVSRMFDALAHGDLTQRMEADYSGAFAKLKNDANSTVERLTEIVGSITDASEQILKGAAEIAAGNAELSQRSEEQASSLEQTASSMEQMTSSVRTNSENSQEANRLAVNAKREAEEGGRVVTAAMSAMDAITSSSRRISDIIGVIDDLAFQTNLLALNAAVEAARAGDQGRGFAVVAGEVRNLAQRSAAAAGEIKALIKDSVGKVEEGTRLVNQSGDRLQAIVESVQSVSQTMQEIAESAREQSAGIEQVNTAVSQMDTMTQQNAALVEQAAAASESMSDLARQMTQQMEFFRTEAGRMGRLPPPSR